ncbi:MAG: hypothetical protein KJ065_00100 [Anaerolineae bacterium]|nr:hypothetical protein [Anaerolineae bacterium]
MNTEEHEPPTGETSEDSSPLEEPFSEEAAQDDSVQTEDLVEVSDEEVSEVAADRFDDELEDEPFAVAYAEEAERAEVEDADALLARDQLDLDVDAALAAVASLSDIVADREVSEDAALAAEQPSATPVLSFAPPKPMALRRGSLASIIPAAILIVAGALLTLATTAGAVVPTQFVVWGAIGAVGLLLISYWLSSRRWARGSFFFATLLLLSAAVFYAMTAPDGIGVKGFPLLIVATGVAFILPSLAARPATRNVLLPGILMIVGGLAALGFTLGIFDASLLSLAAQYAWIAPVILIVLWLLPVIFRRRD